MGQKQSRVADRKDDACHVRQKAADGEMLIRCLDRLAVAGCRVVGARRAVIERLASSLGEPTEVVPVVRRLLKMTRSFPELAWKTRLVPPPVLHL